MAEKRFSAVPVGGDPIEKFNGMIEADLRTLKLVMEAGDSDD